MERLGSFSAFFLKEKVDEKLRVPGREVEALAGLVDAPVTPGAMIGNPSNRLAKVFTFRLNRIVAHSLPVLA